MGKGTRLSRVEGRTGIQPNPTRQAYDRRVTPLEQLQRWEDSGGTWEVLRHSPTGALIALMRCDAGEIVDRLESDDPALLAYIADAQ